MKLCQGPKCHTYDTQDRLRGPKGMKVPQTRRRTRLYYGNGNFCDQRCLYDWVDKYIESGLNHFGRITQPIKLEEGNAWYKTFDWDNSYENRTYYTYNRVTREQRPLTKQQYNDSNYTLNER